MFMNVLVPTKISVTMNMVVSNMTMKFVMSMISSLNVTFWILGISSSCNSFSVSSGSKADWSSGSDDSPLSDLSS
jgi:hypothetical protein